jgi:hypothetical protein
MASTLATSAADGPNVACSRKWAAGRPVVTVCAANPAVLQKTATMSRIEIDRTLASSARRAHRQAAHWQFSA